MNKLLKKIKHTVVRSLPPRIYWTLVGFFNPLSAAIEGQEEEESFYKSGNDEVDIFKKIRTLQPYWKTLEIGCGPGRIQYALTQSDIPVEAYGTDFSPSMVAKAKSHVPLGKFSVGDGKSLHQYQNHFFDLVYSFVVFQHMDEEIFMNYLKESHRVLKPNGVLVFQIQSSENIPDYSRPKKHPWHVRKYTRLEVSHFLDMAGFHNVNFFDMKCTPDPTYVDESGFLVRAHTFSQK